MKAVVTGAGGFIGSHLVEHLETSGFEVTAIVHYRAEGRRGWLSSSSQAHVIAGDVCDSDFIRAALFDHDVVFHLAALISIPHSYQSPEQFVSTNTMGTLNVLNSVKELGARLVHMSTSETYGTGRSIPMDETHPINSQSPYAASKAGADQLCLAYKKAFDIDVVIARPFNTYGPRQSVRSVIPNVIVQILRGEHVVQVGSLEATRDFTFVEDTVRALRLLAQASNTSGVYNIGSGNEISIEKLTRKIGSILGEDVEPQLSSHYVRPKESEVLRLLCDAKRIRSIGWEPTIDLEQGILRTIEWIRPRLDQLPLGKLT